MAQGLGEVIKATPEALRRRGVSHILRVGVRYVRGRLPSELSPGLCLDPKGEADTVLELFESDALDVRYTTSKAFPRQLDAYKRRITSTEGNAYVLDDVTLVGRHPVVESNDRYFSASWFGVDMPFFTHERNSVQRNLPFSAVFKNSVTESDPPNQLDCGFLLLTERGNGFHHWFFEVLPKLWWYEAVRAQSDLDPKLVVHSPLSRYQARSLELMGYDTDRIVEHPNERTAVDRLVLAPHPIRLKGNQLQALPEQLQWVGERIESNVDTEASDFSNRVYVSREDADRRRVANEDQVREALAGLGFESYEPGRLSLEEQVKLFAGADIVVGPHGLAFTNMIYATDATLVELFPRMGATETYFVAASELQLQYDFLECARTEESTSTRPRDYDFVAPLSELVDTVQEHT